MSKFYYLADDDIHTSLSDQSTQFRACSFDDESRLAVIEVPTLSHSISAPAVHGLLALLKQANLKPCLYSCADTGNLHIYLFFNKPVECKLIDHALRGLLSACNFGLSVNDLVLYTGNLQLCLPLQPGFAWLNNSLQVRVNRSEIALESALALFLSDVERNSIDFDVFTSNIESLVSVQMGQVDYPDQSKLADSEPDEQSRLRFDEFGSVTQTENDLCSPFDRISAYSDAILGIAPLADIALDNPSSYIERQDVESDQSNGNHLANEPTPMSEAPHINSVSKKANGIDRADNQAFLSLDYISDSLEFDTFFGSYHNLPIPESSSESDGHTTNCDYLTLVREKQDCCPTAARNSSLMNSGCLVAVHSDASSAGTGSFAQATRNLGRKDWYSVASGAEVQFAKIDSVGQKLNFPTVPTVNGQLGFFPEFGTSIQSEAPVVQKSQDRHRNQQSIRGRPPPD